MENEEARACFQSSKEGNTMQKTICKVVYDTDAAQLIHKYT